MSQTTHSYRNTANGKIGEMTEDQAAIWPDLLERVDAPAEVAPAEAAPITLIKPASRGKD